MQQRRICAWSLACRATRVAGIAPAAQASAVAEHAEPGDRGVRFLDRSLQPEAQRTLYLFDEGAYGSTRLWGLQMTEQRVASHSRSAIASNSPLSQGFVSSEQLELETRARRRFATLQLEVELATPPSEERRS